jgi:hypothetical protein
MTTPKTHVVYTPAFEKRFNDAYPELKFNPAEIRKILKRQRKSHTVKVSRGKLP